MGGGRLAFRVGYFLWAALWPDFAPAESFPSDAFFEPLSAFPVDAELEVESEPFVPDASPLPVESPLESVASLLGVPVASLPSVLVVVLESVAAEDVSLSLAVRGLVSADALAVLAADEPASLSDVAASFFDVVVALAVDCV